MPFDFDTVIPRRGTGSNKWEQYPEDVLPMWVADMDFPSPEPVVQALHERADHRFFGYASPATKLAEAVCERLARLYRWEVTPEQVVFVPSLVSGINIVCRATGTPGSSVLTLVPAYPPFLGAPANHGLVCDTLELTETVDGRTLHYDLDLDAFAGAIHERTRLLLLSSPHNPVGKIYAPETLRSLAEICLRNNVVICSDEIHCDLLLGGARHTPLATLAPEIAERTVTLMSPSKTFNLPGLGCGLAIVPNPALRKQLQQASTGIVPHVNVMGLAAAHAAFTRCEDWLEELRAYLTANRDYLIRYLAEQLPQLRYTVPQATYLAWIDCREAGISGSPYRFFLDEARVALGEGKGFGAAYEPYVRLNFGCPRALLVEGLERMRMALERAGARRQAA